MLRVTRQQYSLKYTHHVQLPEMRQPDWIVKKYHGSSGDYTSLPADWSHTPARMRAHQNLWQTDLGPRTNIMMANHDTIAPYNKLLGRKSHHAAAGIWRISGYSDTDLEMDQRWKGAQRNAIANLVDEPLWNSIMYPLDTLRKRSAPNRNYAAEQGVRMTTLAELQPDGIPLEVRLAASTEKNNSTTKNNSSDATTKQQMDPVETYKLMTIKTKEHVEAYWKNLAHIISVNRPAVGDLPEVFRSRSIRHAHEAFVKFQDALRSHNFQDSYLIRHLQDTKPRELEDVFGVFLEMEANYINHDYCPRCSLPFATTRYCGEGDAHTPFRTNRGRWAPHKSWGKEWYDVVVRRAEQLWYRSTEDPLFGTPQHTQKQVEELLRVYCKTGSRGKAIHFMTSLRGSLEYLQGKIKITDKMQKDLDALLDSTPHPHMLTNGFKAQPNGAAAYLLSSVSGGAANASAATKASTLPHSPLQFRIDLELGKLRREQKEQGAVRLPPKGWRINTENIVPYKIGNSGKVTNWRQVKEGIEKSFLDTGLPKEAYTADELREIAYLNAHIATRDEKRAALKAAFEAERETARKEGKLNKKDKVIFPTDEYYQIFEVTDAALAPFNLFVQGGTAAASTGTEVSSRLKYGMTISAERKQFNDPANVVMSLGQSTYTVDTTDATCKLYGFLHGQVVTYTDAESKESRTVIVLGVEKQSSAQHQLLAVDARGVAHSLGYDIEDVHGRCLGIAVDPSRPRRPPKVMANLLTVTESFATGTVIGVRKGELFVSWDNGVAANLGSAEVMGASLWRIYPTSSSTAAASSSSSSSSASSDAAFYPTPREPYSWVTPFRNDWSEERLEELKKAPFNRERYVSLIQNKFTPIVKRFGYTQHITQDDFVTKEYKDRLTSKQFFTNPQAFEIIPDESNKSVRFGGKDEVAFRLQGLPSADRNELENGWEEVPEVSVSEVQAIEQGLRDISGKRPGNYIKTAAEAGSLKLNESWFASLNLGWKQEAKEQKFLENGADRKTIDSSKIPFGGSLPAFGTTYGIGERIREVYEDFSKGFGLGGSCQQSPGADNNHLNVLGFESNNAQTLGYGNILLRLFNEKLGASSIYSLAGTLANDHRVDPRDLLLSLNEWRHAGRNPSPVLKRVLADYLSTEIEKYNQFAAKGTDRIDLLGFGGSADGSTIGASSAASRAGMINSATTSPWVDVERDAFKTDYFIRQRDIASGESGESKSGASAGDDGFVMSRVVEMGLRHAAGTSDESLAAHCASQIASKFALQLSEAVGKDIPLTRQALAQSNVAKGRRPGINAVQLVRADVLKGLLRSVGIGDSVIATIISGLSQTPDVVPLERDFAFSLQTILMWKGPSIASSATSPSPANAASAVSSRRGGASDGIVKFTRSSLDKEVLAIKNARENGAATHTGATQGRFSMNPIYNTILVSSEGAALDFAYAATENMKNRALRREFVEACRDVIPVPQILNASSSSPLTDEQKQQRATHFYDALYDRYCEGLWAPTFEEAQLMFVNFLKKCNADPRILVEYFNFKGEDQVGVGARNTQVSGLNKKRFVNTPFTFDNVAVEAIKAKQMSRTLQDLPPDFVFVSMGKKGAASSSSDAANTTETAASSSASSSQSAVAGIIKKGATPSSAASAASSSSSVAQSTSASSSINTQNYFDGNVNEFVSAVDERAIQALFGTLRKAFPLGDNFYSQNNNASTAVKAPPAPGTTYSGPFVSFLGNPLQSAKVFRQWCDTIFPLLPTHLRTINTYLNSREKALGNNDYRIGRFQNILENEAGEALEREFRQNAERYWRRAIDGKGLEEFVATTSGAGDRQSNTSSGAPQRRNVNFGNNTSSSGGQRSSGGGGRGRGGVSFSNMNNSGNKTAHGEALRQGMGNTGSTGRGVGSSFSSGRGRSSGFAGGRGGGGRGRGNTTQ